MYRVFMLLICFHIRSLLFFSHDGSLSELLFYILNCKVISTSSFCVILYLLFHKYAILQTLRVMVVDISNHYCEAVVCWIDPRKKENEAPAEV